MQRKQFLVIKDKYRPMFEGFFGPWLARNYLFRVVNLSVFKNRSKGSIFIPREIQLQLRVGMPELVHIQNNGFSNSN